MPESGWRCFRHRLSRSLEGFELIAGRLVSAYGFCRQQTACPTCMAGIANGWSYVITPRSCINVCRRWRAPPLPAPIRMRYVAARQQQRLDHRVGSAVSFFFFEGCVSCGSPETSAACRPHLSDPRHKVTDFHTFSVALVRIALILALLGMIWLTPSTIIQ